MTDLTDIEFDHKAPSVKRRELNRGVTHIQNGVVFSAGFVPLEPYQTPSVRIPTSALKEAAAAPKQRKKKAAGTARERAADKLAGFKEDEMPDAVSEALAEDAGAKKAEELAQ